MTALQDAAVANLACKTQKTLRSQHLLRLHRSAVWSRLWLFLPCTLTIQVLNLDFLQDPFGRPFSDLERSSGSYSDVILVVHWSDSGYTISRTTPTVLVCTWMPPLHPVRDRSLAALSSPVNSYGLLFSVRVVFFIVMCWSERIWWGFPWLESNTCWKN